jgi:hypothetical protein
MRKVISALFGLCILLAVAWPSSLWADSASVPDWVRNASTQAFPAYPADTNAVVLLAQEDMTVTAPGDYVEHQRRVVKILRPDGRDEGRLRVHLGHEEKLLSLRAWTIDKTGRQYELREKDFEEQNPYYHSFYDDIRYRTARAPSMSPSSTAPCR